jgi:hypothetical protein
MKMLRELWDKADQRGQTSAAIRAEELREQLRRFYIKQIETGDAGEFERMSTEELRAYVYGTSDELPPKGKGPVKHWWPRVRRRRHHVIAVRWVGC